MIESEGYMKQNGVVDILKAAEKTEPPRECQRLVNAGEALAYLKLYFEMYEKMQTQIYDQERCL